MSKNQEKTDFVIQQIIEHAEEMSSKIEIQQRLHTSAEKNAKKLQEKLKKLTVFAKMLPGFLEHERSEAHDDFLNKNEDELSLLQDLNDRLKNKSDLN